ncbi:MAG: ATP-binding protein [Candidatus Pacebacteria bacterium]|nr:ATP-binding protein [Candidatus Paceibacterota bacterium]
MINKNINDITFNDIENLIDSVREGKQIDFKIKFPDLKEKSDRKEFLYDVTSFANTIGGLLIYGIEESKGTAKRIVSLPDNMNFDQEILKLENIIRDGVEPRIKTDIRLVESEKKEKVLIIKVFKSWSSPHRVILGGSGKFHARNSAGKYELDVSELRSMFNSSELVIDKVKNFRDNRMMKIVSGELPIEFSDSMPKIVLHIIPIESFHLQFKPDLEKIININPPIYPFCCSSKNVRRNLEGVLFFHNYGNGDYNSYIQVYRNGIIEIVNNSFFNNSLAKGKLINPLLERELFKYYKDECIKILKNLDIGGPVVIGFSLVGVNGFTISNQSCSVFSDAERISEDNVLFPEVLMNNFSEKPEGVFKEIFELFWNACSMKRPVDMQSKIDEIINPTN